MQQSAVYRTFEWITPFLLLNITWVIVNIPVWLGIALAVRLPDLLLLLAPLVAIWLYPTTVALFCCVRQLSLHDDLSYVTKTFIRFLTENSGKSLPTGVIFTTLIAAGIYRVTQASSVLTEVVALVLTAVLVIGAIYSFLVMAHYKLSIIGILQKSFLFTFGCVKLSLFIGVIGFIFTYMTVNGLYLFALTFGTALLASFIWKLFAHTTARLDTKMT